MVSTSELNRVVELCESRLNRAKALDDNDGNNSEYWVFPPSVACLYHHMLGDAYLQLFKSSIQSKTIKFQLDIDHIGERSLQVLMEGMELANENLPITDSERLQCSFVYCV
jgi:hypothetical protein